MWRVSRDDFATGLKFVMCPGHIIARKWKIFLTGGKKVTEKVGKHSTAEARPASNIQLPISQDSRIVSLKIFTEGNGGNEDKGITGPKARFIPARSAGPGLVMRKNF
jgi:hypothetical protein